MRPVIWHKGEIYEVRAVRDVGENADARLTDITNGGHIVGHATWVTPSTRTFQRTFLGTWVP